MDKNRKNLFVISIVILAWVVWSIAKSIVEICINGGLELPEVEGVSKEIMLVAAIIALVIVYIALVPQIYIGIKGIKIAKGAQSGKAHIVWAIILGAIAALGFVSSLAGLGKFSADVLLDIGTSACSLALYACYISFACKIAKE